MNFNEVCVLVVLAVCCFVANVLHGLTGCGSILVLHALWQTAVTFSPDVLHGTKAFGDENVKSIAEFSYVLTFFIQVVLTALLFFDERRKRAQQQEQGVPLTPSELNGVLLLAFIPCSFIGAAVGVYTMPSIRENGSRIILGGSSLFFALTFLSLYQMKYLEKKKTEDVIRDDLMLMRIQSEVQRHVIIQYMEDQKRRKARKERRRRHRAQRLQAKKAEKLRRRELRMKALAAYANANGATPDAAAALAAAGGSSASQSAAAAATGNYPALCASAPTPSSLVVVPPGDAVDGGVVVQMPELEGAPLEPNLALRSSSAGTDPLMSSRTSRTLGVHGASHMSSPHAHMISEVRLPQSVLDAASEQQQREDANPLDAEGNPKSSWQRRHHLHRLWIKEVDVQTYIRTRLAEMSRHADSPDEEVAHEARLAAWTLRAMEGHEGDPDVVSPYTPSPHERFLRSRSGDDGDNASSSSSSSSSSSGPTGDSASDTDLEGSTVTSATASTNPPFTSGGSSHAASRQSREGAEGGGGGFGDTPNPHAARTVRFDSSAEATRERAELHKKWKALLANSAAAATKSGSSNSSLDLSKSIAMAAAAAPRRVVMGHSEVLNIGLREAQQQQLKSLQELNSSEYKREHHHHRLVHFMRMDGGVVMSAMVSSFFSGLFGSYTGVADPPLMIFALAMDISVPELRINYAVSSIVPAALRAVVGIADGFANTSLFVYYLVSVLFAWGGVAFGLHISHHNVVTHTTFMIATVVTLLLVAFLMLVPINEAFMRLVATAGCFIVVAYAIFRQQKKPEHHRPPAPPNTPATAAEVAAFDLYWRQHSRRQQALMDYEVDGSAAVSMTSNTSTRMEESVRSGTTTTASVPPTPRPRPLWQRQRETEESFAKARGAALAREDLPMRAHEEDEEELITVIPVKATSHV